LHLIQILAEMTDHRAQMVVLLARRLYNSVQVGDVGDFVPCVATQPLPTQTRCRGLG
jgi:hypothetical protein